MATEELWVPFVGEKSLWESDKKKAEELAELAKRTGDDGEPHAVLYQRVGVPRSPEDTKSCITTFFHCMECMPLKPSGVAPKEWSAIEVGFTRKGIQVRCTRCDKNIVHFDFKGQTIKVIPGE
jgi:hypothetical protein